MAKEHVRQHFIPQCYLRNFSENEKFVYVYSKTNKNKGYAQSITKTAYKDYFYAIPEKYLNKALSTNIDTNFIEKKILAEKIENLYSQLLSKILKSASAYITHDDKEEVFNSKERDLFAALIAIQYLRMPNIRDKYWDAQQKAQKERNEMVSAIKRVYEDIDCSEATAMNKDDDYAPVMHSGLFLDEELITGIQDQMIKKIWKYRITTNGTVFTSDNPILLKPHLNNQLAFYEGFAMKGVEIIFPISKNIILTIWDEDVFYDNVKENNKFTILTGKELRQYNCYQYIWANDEVFSSNNDFKLIEYLKAANGDINKEILMELPNIKVNGK
jgi:hypothetical protein